MSKIRHAEAQRDAALSPVPASSSRGWQTHALRYVRHRCSHYRSPHSQRVLLQEQTAVRLDAHQNYNIDTVAEYEELESDVRVTRSRGLRIAGKS